MLCHSFIQNKDLNGTPLSTEWNVNLFWLSNKLTLSSQADLIYFLMVSPSLWHSHNSLNVLLVGNTICSAWNVFSSLSIYRNSIFQCLAEIVSVPWHHSMLSFPLLLLYCPLHYKKGVVAALASTLQLEMLLIGLFGVRDVSMQPIPIANIKLVSVVLRLDLLWLL